MADLRHVRKIYEVSTGHLPEYVARAINDDLFPKKPAMYREEGWLFSVPENLSYLPEHTGFSFRRIMALSMDAGCDWVLFDRDVPPVEYLHLFDW